MTTVSPVTQNLQLVDQSGLTTPAFKRYLDDQLQRTGWISGGKYTALADGPTVFWDVDRDPVAVLLLTGDRHLSGATGQVAGNFFPYRLTVVQDAAGGHALTWAGSYRFPGGLDPAVSPAPLAVDEYVFASDGTNMRLVGGAQDLR